MEFTEFFKERKRMCAAMDAKCHECGLSYINNGRNRDCGTLYPELSPLRAEELSAMVQIIEMVCYDLCLSASVSLPDDTSLRITPDAVERKRTIKRKEKIS